MKKMLQLSPAAIASCLLLAASNALGADIKTYQVTGPVLEVTPTKIVVQKGEDKWELNRTKDSKVPADVKVGTKVTIHYSMVVDEVELKGDKPERAEKKKK